MEIGQLHNSMAAAPVVIREPIENQAPVKGCPSKGTDHNLDLAVNNRVLAIVPGAARTVLVVGPELEIVPVTEEHHRAVVQDLVVAAAIASAVGAFHKAREAAEALVGDPV